MFTAPSHLPTPIEDCRKYHDSDLAWRLVASQESEVAQQTYRAIRKASGENLARLQWLVDAIDSGDGYDVGRQLRETPLPTDRIPAPFLTLAIESGVVRLKLTRNVPDQKLDRYARQSNGQPAFEFSELLDSFELDAELAKEDDWELLRGYLERMAKGDLSCHPEHQLTDVLERMGINLSRGASDANPARSDHGLSYGGVGNVRFDGTLGDIFITTYGMLFVPSPWYVLGNLKIRRALKESSLLQLERRPDSTWVPWEEIRESSLSRRTIWFHMSIGWLYLLDNYYGPEQMSHRIEITLHDGRSHTLRTTYFTYGTEDAGALIDEGVSMYPNATIPSVQAARSEPEPTVVEPQLPPVENFAHETLCARCRGPMDADTPKSSLPQPIPVHPK